MGFVADIISPLRTTSSVNYEDSTVSTDVFTLGDHAKIDREMLVLGAMNPHIPSQNMNHLLAALKVITSHAQEKACWMPKVSIL